ncbi:receptor protein kinase [Trifolium repens]|nr:receptor protein kinase [Trifolium repens]
MTYRTSFSSRIVTLLLFTISFLHGATTLNSDGLTLMSLLTHWTSVPNPIRSSWNASDSNPCSWFGVQCDHIHNVISINLTRIRISGQLGPEIGNLDHLQTLVLLGNGFSGTIPSSLGNCSKLEHLELSFNRLRGEIPVSIWRIPSLVNILVNDNSLSGELPFEMTNLKYLKNISLFDNQFSGVIPQSLGINSSIVKLDFTNNKFSGTIPPNLCFGKNLRELNMGSNQLQGGVPSDVGRCATLVRLFLNDNNFTGSLPKFESNLNMKYMDISKNSISGPIPSSLGNCTNLTYINLSWNKFGGLVPSELGNLVNLVILDLSLLIISCKLGGNLFGGKIPPSIGTLQNLFYGLNLSANGLIGHIPFEIKDLEMLQSLDISLNNLTGSIDALAGLVSLLELNISYNFFTGSVPATTILEKLLSSSPSSFMVVCAVKKLEFEWNKKKRINIMRNEIEVLEKCRHRNLIKCYGYWIGNDYGLILSRLMENGCLNYILHEEKPPPPLTWNVRFNIAVGIAQGLAYLHYDCVPPVVHRDIKPENILLDNNMEPIIADFGTALCKNLFEDSNSHSETRKMLSSHVVGTPGYIAPENAYDIVPGRKSDVYSYGVVLLELITRKKLLVPSISDEANEIHIVTWARSVMMETGKIENIVDPYLVSEFPNSIPLAKQVTAVLSLALQCTEKDPRKRPTMKGVIGFYNKKLFKIRCDEVQYGGDGLVIKLMGNGKILSEKPKSYYSINTNQTEATLQNSE